MKKGKDIKMPITIQIEEFMVEHLDKIAASKGLGRSSYVRSVLFKDINRELELLKKR